MRILAILLLLLNAGYFGWQQGWLFEREIEAPGAIRAPYRQAPQALVMLAEISPAQRELMDQISASQQRASAAQQQLVDAEQEAAEVQDELALATTRSPADIPADITDELPASPDGAVPAQPELPWCAVAGAFPEEEVAAAYVEAVKVLGGRGSIASRRERVGSVWWVHLPAFPSEAEARRTLAELQGKSIDSFYMADGELAGGISLGVFSRESSAQTAQAQFAARDYTATVTEVDRLGTRYYADFELPSSALQGRAELARFSASIEGLQVTEKLCEVIAQENVFP